jgi:L,D-peptidoglycan transpeptidase YkuD (ErfK/YbiS/YcfS/YnhG family)
MSTQQWWDENDKEQDSNVRVSVTLRGLHVTNVGVEKQCMSLALVIQHAKIFLCVLSGSSIFFHIIP